MNWIGMLAFVALLLMAVEIRGQTTAPSTQPTLKGVYGNDFLIGVALGGKLPGNYSPAELAVIKTQFNAVTPENCMKAQSIHPAENTWNFDQADALVKFAQDNQMQIFGHNLLWHEGAPRWFFSDGENPASRELVLARLKNHIETEVGRYKGKIRGWDVVNEALADSGNQDLRSSPWLTSLGPDYVIQAFKFAHEADPDAELQYNDYNIESGAKRAKAVRLIKSLKEAGVPLTAVGIQGHWVLDHVPYDDIDKAIDEFHALGVKVMITELDLDVYPRQGGADVNQKGTTPASATQPSAETMRRQAEQYAKLFALFHKHRDAITRVTFWGLNDGRSWLNTWPTKRVNHPLLFDRQSRPKEAFDAVIEAAKTPANN